MNITQYQKYKKADGGVYSDNRGAVMVMARKIKMANGGIVHRDLWK